MRHTSQHGKDAPGEKRSRAAPQRASKESEGARPDAHRLRARGARARGCQTSGGGSIRPCRIQAARRARHSGSRDRQTGTRRARSILTTVLDASATVGYLIGSARAATVRKAVRYPGESLHIPALCDVEVTSALRRLLLRKILSEDRATEALEDYLDLPLVRHGHQNLLARALSFRTNFSAYDAIYVALAERLGATLLTGDEGLARAAENHLVTPAVLV